MSLDNLTCFDLGDEDFEVTDESLQRRAKWKRWSKEYLLDLRDTHHRRNASKTSTPQKIGDIVHDEDDAIGFWKFGLEAADWSRWSGA